VSTTAETAPETDQPEADQPVPRGAAVTSGGLGLRTRRGWVFRDVDLDIAPGELVAVTGPSGSGRTSLLLAVAGRFTVSHGSLTVADLPLPAHARRVQRLAGLGYAPGAHEPEPALTALEHVTERMALLGLGGWWPARRRSAARKALRTSPYHGGPATLGRDLSPYQRHLLGLALAQLTEPRLVVVDDLDVGTDSAERAALWAELRQLAEGGTTVLAACRETDSEVDQVVHLKGDA